MRIPPTFTFIAHPRFATLLLAYVLDSLVRVSRRADGSHLCQHLEPTGPALPKCFTTHARTDAKRVCTSMGSALGAGRQAWASLPRSRAGFNKDRSRRSDQRPKPSPPPRIDADQQGGMVQARTMPRPWDPSPYDMLQSLVLLTISSPFSLSFQSSFHLSFTVLVRYRSLASI